jgi:hypothetical protein
VLEVTLHVNNQLAAALSSAERSGALALSEKKGGLSAARRISAIAERHGVQVAPMHPGTSDPELRKHFFIQVTDQGAGERLSDELRGLPGVEGVYFKSSGEPPG